MAQGSVPGARPSRVALRLISDDRLARLAAGGDERAFAVIYDRHAQGIYRYCGSILRDPHDTADAFQSTMMSAFGGAPAHFFAGRFWVL
jgi:DNA-directed RNA polymerase specialized sigma24 family protein